MTRFIFSFLHFCLYTLHYTSVGCRTHLPLPAYPTFFTFTTCLGFALLFAFCPVQVYNGALAHTAACCGCALPAVARCHLVGFAVPRAHRLHCLPASSIPINWFTCSYHLNTRTLRRSVPSPRPYEHHHTAAYDPCCACSSTTTGDGDAGTARRFCTHDTKTAGFARRLLTGCADARRGCSTLRDNTRDTLNVLCTDLFRSSSSPRHPPLLSYFTFVGLRAAVHTYPGAHLLPVACVTKHVHTHFRVLYRLVLRLRFYWATACFPIGLRVPLRRVAFSSTFAHLPSERTYLHVWFSVWIVPHILWLAGATPPNIL